MASRKTLIAGVVIAVSVLSMAAVGAVKTLSPKGPSYITEVVRVGDIEQTVHTAGTLIPAETVDVGTPVGGQLMTVSVKMGDRVKAGQVIAQIESQRLQNELRDRESQLESQRRNVMMFTSNVDFATAQMSRQETLKKSGFGAGAAYDQAAGRLRNTRSELANFQGQLKTAEIGVEGAKEQLEKATIRAPADGIVAEIVARPGQQLNTNRETPVILKISKMDVMTVRAQVSEADIVKVKPGQKVYFTVLGFPAIRYYAKLRTRDVTPADGILEYSGGANGTRAIYYNALFETPNPKGELLPAMTVDVRVVLNEARNVLSVPVAALGPAAPDGRRPARVLSAEGKLVQRMVQVGLTDAAMAEVKSGLKAGERVVVGEAG